MNIMTHQGAEALIFHDKQLYGLNVIVKYRKLLDFLHPTISKQLVQKRQMNEVLMLKRLGRLHIRAPRVFEVAERLLVLEYIQGHALNPEDDQRIFQKLGLIIARLHNAGLTHGDLNPKNILIETFTNEIVLLDPSMGSLKASTMDQVHDLISLYNTTKFFSNTLFFRTSFHELYDQTIENKNILTQLKEVLARGRNKH